MKFPIFFISQVLWTLGTLGQVANAQTSVTPTTGANCPSPVTAVLNAVGAPTQIKAVSDYFKPGQLEKYKLQLGGADGTALMDVTDPANPALLGNVKIVNAPFTYEWAETPTHLAWLRDKGIAGYEMKQDIIDPGQAAGKGYYVSTNPIDSISYGHGLTVFRPGREMVILKQPANDNAYTFVNGAYTATAQSKFTTVVNDTNWVNKLKSAGIDGFQNAYTETWYSIISDSLLHGVSGVDAEYLRDYIKQNSPTDVLSTMLGFETRPWESKELEKYFPKGHPLLKLLKQEPLTPAEATAYAEQILNLPNHPSLNTNEKFFTYLHEKVFKPYLQEKLETSDTSGLNAVMNFITKTNVTAKTSSEMFDSMVKLSPAQKRYQDMLAAADLYDIASANTPEKLSALKTSTNQFMAAQSALKKVKNPGLNDMMAAMQKATGKPLQFRTAETGIGTLQADGTYSMNANYQSYSGLNSNKLLSVNTHGQPVWNTPGTFNMSVEYPSIKNYQNYSSVLSPDLLNKLNTMGTNPTPDVIASMNSAIVQELTNALFDPQKRIDITGILSGYAPAQLPTYRQYIKPTTADLYKAFLSIHPFQDGNEQMAKLFFQYSDQNVTNPIAAELQKAQMAAGQVYSATFIEIQAKFTAATAKANALTDPTAKAAALAQATADQSAAYQAAATVYYAALNPTNLAATAATTAEGEVGSTVTPTKNLEVGHPLSLPTSDFALMAGSQLPSYMPLQPAVSRWTANAANDSDFVTRSQNALSAIVQNNPALASVMPPIPGAAAAVPVAAPAIPTP